MRPDRGFGGPSLITSGISRHSPMSYDHDHEDAGQHRQRDVAGERRREQQDQQQRDGVGHAGDRACGHRPDVGRGAGDGAGCRQAAEQRRQRRWRRPARSARRSDRGGRRDMRSATTAESSDSIAPSIATVRAGDSSVRIRSTRNAGTCSVGRPLGTPPNRLPMVSTGSPAGSADAVPAISATMVPGRRRDTRRQRAGSPAMVSSAEQRGRAPRPCPHAAASTLQRGRGTPRARSGVCRPKKSRICVLAMRTPMPLVKPITTGRGMNFTAVPRPVTPEQDQDDAGHQRAHEQAVEAVGRDDARDDDDERAGRPADLHPRAAERRDDETGDDRAVDAVLRRQPRRDGEGHGQRERDQADGDAGEEVAAERTPAVPLAQALHELGRGNGRSVHQIVRGDQPGR